MSELTRKVFLPGLAAMMVGVSGDRLLWWTHSSMPNIYWLGKSLYPSGARGFIAIEPILLMFFVVGGALAAWISSQQNGTRNQRVLAAELPAIVMGSLLTVSILISLAAGLLITKFHADFRWMLNAYLGYLVGWVLLPAMALFVGAMPFVRENEVRGLVSNR